MSSGNLKNLGIKYWDWLVQRLPEYPMSEWLTSTKLEKSAPPMNIHGWHGFSNFP